MRVWYAAYGSNLSRARLDCYLRGGRPAGARHTFPGCRDPSPAVADVPAEIELELAFGGSSATWGGGVALVRRTGAAPTKARLYLLTLEQFTDIVAQENWLAPGSVGLPDPAELDDEPVVLDGDHSYRVVIGVGEREGLPVLTVSQPEQTRPAAPSRAYLRHIADGLRESHGMSAGQIAGYLASKSGVAGVFATEELVAAVS